MCQSWRVSKWSLHNGTEMDNCRSRKPRDKSPAESLVMQVYNYFYSRIMNYGPDGGMSVFCLSIILRRDG